MNKVQVKKAVGGYLFPGWSNLLGVTNVKNTVNQVKDMFKRNEQARVVETFEEAQDRFGLDEAGLTVVEKGIHLQTRMYGFTAALMPLAFGLSGYHGVLGSLSALTLTLLVFALWFRSALRLWQVRSRYLGTFKEFVATPLWFASWI